MMIQPRQSLNVRDGFWKGLNAKNLATGFQAEEHRKLDAESAADYDLPSGKEFEPCRRVIRPYLDDWAKDITLSGKVSGIYDDLKGADDIAALPGGMAEDPRAGAVVAQGGAVEETGVEGAGVVDAAVEDADVSAVRGASDSANQDPHGAVATGNGDYPEYKPDSGVVDDGADIQSGKGNDEDLANPVPVT
ncbi:hypothetical protein PG994_004224 [Apiospora phragmitis]|uniref:Uncharacterized protein n=1 Tax=Apiospora phragmitis TaxID=2905665 RepID=A0ABR1VT30_9PEZI